MARPSRARRMYKWTGLGLSLLILVAWIVSMWCSAELNRPRTHMWFNAGQVCIFRANYDIHFPRTVMQSKLEWHSWRDFGFRLPRFFKDPTQPREASKWSVMVHIPFWLLLLITAIPTAWLWHRDRRLISCSPDHLLCSGCGYDLTGNTSGVCSECGEKMTPVSQAPSRQGRV